MPVRVSSTDTLEKAILSLTDPATPARYQPDANFPELLSRVRHCRGWGDGYGYFLTAEGRVDLMLDPIMNEWDYAALVPVIRGAGGVITDWQGNALSGETSAIAANPTLHRLALQVLNG